MAISINTFSTSRDILKAAISLVKLKLGDSSENKLLDYEKILKENGENMVYDYYAYLECNYDAERFWESTLKEKKPEFSPAEPTWWDDDNERDERHNLNDCGYSFLETKCINNFKAIQNDVIVKAKQISKNIKDIENEYSNISEDLKSVNIEGLNLSEDYQQLSKNMQTVQKYLNSITEQIEK